MKKLTYISILLAGLIVPSFTAHAMFRSFFSRTRRPLSPKIQRVTPDKYYNYDYYHSDYRMNEWQQQKNFIREAIENAKNDPELIKKIVNQTEYSKSGYTPLCHAAEMNDCDFAQFLLNHGAEINEEIQGVHSSKPIFFSDTLEMTRLLHDNGANMHCYNEGQGVTGGMNLLHAGIHCNTQDDRLFDYMLSQGSNPNNLTLYRGGNLWHSLISCSVRYCPEKRLFSRVKKLHDLTINPYHKDKRGESAIDIIGKEITSELKYLNTHKHLNSQLPSDNDNVRALNKLIRLHDGMKVIKTTQFIEKE